jgi:iron complex transport system substrate-binding protein
MADDARYSGVAGRWPTSMPRLGHNPEELLASGAELVIVASFSNAEYRAAIADHAELLVLDDFSGFTAYLDNLARIGEAVGAEPEALARVRERFTTRRAALEAARPPEGARPSVIAWEAGHVPGADTTFDDIATCAGFRNLAAAQGLVGHQRVDAEQLVAWDPAWIVIGCGEQPCSEAIDEFAALPGFDHLQALRDTHVIAIEAPALGSVGEGMLDAAARMQAALLEDAR